MIFKSVIVHDGQSFFEMLGEYILIVLKVALIGVVMLIGFIVIIAEINNHFQLSSKYNFLGLFGLRVLSISLNFGLPC